MSRAPQSASSTASSSPSTSPRAKYLRPAQPRTGGQQSVNPSEYAKVRKGDERAVEVLNDLLDARGTENTTIARTIGCPEKTVRDIRSRERRKPLKVGHLYAIASTDQDTALAIWDAIRADILTGSHGE